MKILAIYDKSGPKYHRILVPLHMMPFIDVVVKHIPVEADFAGVDIVFFNRMIPGIAIEELLQFRNKYGFKLINDLDDHWILDKTHYLHETYKKYGISERIFGFITSADAVTVTHERLYHEVKPYNDNVHILPNAIAKTDQFLVKKTPDDLMRFFWAGGVTHRNDLELLRTTLPRIKRDKIKLVMAGYDKNDQAEWGAMAKIFTTNSSYNTMVIQSAPVHEYYKAFTLCDVALIPLVETSFNIHKSNLKILEAANVAAPVIVSKVHPYLDFPEDIVNYVTSAKPWYAQMMSMIKDPARIEDQGMELKEYCDEHYNFDRINTERKQLFEHIKTKNHDRVGVAV